MMTVNVFKFISSNKGEFNCFDRAIINGDYIVRPATDREQNKTLGKVVNSEKTSLLLLKAFNRGLDEIATIMVELNIENVLFFKLLDSACAMAEIEQINTQLIDFFRKNFVVDKIIVGKSFIFNRNCYHYIDEIAGSITISASKGPAKDLILTAGPSITPLEVCYAADAARNGWNSNWKKYLAKFEEEFANYVGAKYAIATSCCTGALQISLMALGVGKGDEVLVPDLTWVASATAIRDAGATPIFVDVELDSWNIDVNSLERKITDRTKAIVVVHMYGGSARMDQIVEFARKHNLSIVEDAAPAIGAEWNGKRVGTFGDFGCYSFQGAKLLVTGEGGMIVTNDEQLHKKALKVSDQGRDPTKTFWIDGKGVKFKMSNVQAALGLAQIQRADVNIALKRRIFGWYNERLKNSDFLKLNEEIPNSKSIYWMTSIRLLDGARSKRDELIKILREHNIDSRPVFPAISQYPIWEIQQQSNPVAKLIGDTSINLPSGVGLCKAEVDYICDIVLQNV